MKKIALLAALLAGTAITAQAASTTYTSSRSGPVLNGTYGPYPEETWTLHNPPTGAPLKEVSLCIVMHGGYDLGGNDNPNNANVGYAANYLAFRGCPTMAIDYRLTTTAGQEFPASIQDLQLAIRYAHAQGYPRVVVVGLSAGAFNVLTAAFTPGTIASGLTDPLGEANTLTKYSSEAACWVAVSPFSDLNDPNLSQMAINHITRVPDTASVPKDVLRASMSPVDNIPKSWRIAPLLVIHGRQDPMIPYNESVVLTTMLERAGQPYEFFPTQGGHVFGMLNRYELGRVLREIGDWANADKGTLCAQTTGGKYP